MTPRIASLVATTPVRKFPGKIIGIIITLLILGGGFGFYYFNTMVTPMKSNQVTPTSPSPTTTSNDSSISQISVQFNLPAESPLNNEDLILDSWADSVNVKAEDIRSRKLISINILGPINLQTIFIEKIVNNSKPEVYKYNIPVYLKQNNNVYSIDAKTIANGLIWPFLKLATTGQLNVDVRESVLVKINNDKLFTGTFLNEVTDLLKNKPEELGGDLQSERGEKLWTTAAQLVKDNLESKVAETKVSSSYLDCGNNSETKNCMMKAATNCSLAKGTTSDPSGMSIENIIDGTKDGKCLYRGTILSSSFGISGLKINCSLNNNQVSQIFSTGLKDLSSCSGSFVDFMKKQTQ